MFCKHDYKVKASQQRNQAESNNSGVLCFGNGCSDLVGYQNVFVDAYLIVVTIFMQCSWGSKPTLPGTLSLPLPPPPPMGPFQGVLPAGINQGYSAADLLAYQRQILTQASTGRALLPLPHQQGMGLGMGQALMGTQGSHGVFDGFQPGAGLAGGHERMYY